MTRVGSAPGERRGELCDRPAQPHALRRGLRHLAVRRGVAAARRSRACYLPLLELLERLAAERRSRRCATIGVTPVLADQLALPEVGERFLRFMREVRARVPPPRRRRARAGRRARPPPTALRRSAARLRARGGGVRAPRTGPARRASRGSQDAGVIELWTSAATPRRAAAARDRAGRRGSSSQTGIASHRARFGAWSGGFWLPECAYRPGSRSSSAQPACAPSASTRRAVGERARPARARRDRRSGPVAVPIDWATIELSGTTAAIRATRSTATTTRHTLNGLRPWANGGAPYDAGRGAARAARARARLRRRGRAIASTRYRAERGRPGLLVLRARHRAARPLVVRGAGVARGGRRGGARRRASALATLPEALERHDARPSGRWSTSTWGDAQGPARPGTRRRSRDSSGRAAEAELRARVGAVAHGPAAGGRAGRGGRARRARAARAPVERLGVHGHARARRRLSRAARAGHCGGLRAGARPLLERP